MKKILCLLSAVLIIATASCSTKTPKANASTSSETVTLSSAIATTSIPVQTPKSSSGTDGVAVKTSLTQSKSFSNIDMVTINYGYAITKDFHLAKTSNSGRNWVNILTINNISDDSEEPALFVLDDKTIYIASYMTTGIEVEKSIDAGISWSKIAIKMQVADANSGYGGSLMLSFINKSDGFLLTSSGPACGQMSKALYKTTNGGNNWYLISSWDLNGDYLISAKGGKNTVGINGYTTGMTFFNANIGFITCTYHGQTETSVYKTTDGGKSWFVTSFPLPEKFVSLKYNNYYIDAYPPVLIGQDNKNAKMELYFCHEGECHVYIYSSNNGGDTWCIDEISNILMRNYCFVDDKNGFGLDDYGKLYATKNDGITWSILSYTNSD